MQQKGGVAKYVSMKFKDQLGKQLASYDWVDQSRLLILNPFRAGVILNYENGRQLVQSGQIGGRCQDKENEIKEAKQSIYICEAKRYCHRSTFVL